MKESVLIRPPPVSTDMSVKDAGARTGKGLVLMRRVLVFKCGDGACRVEDGDGSKENESSWYLGL
jgi:hypothetical protein